MQMFGLIHFYNETEMMTNDNDSLRIACYIRQYKIDFHFDIKQSVLMISIHYT